MNPLEPGHPSATTDDPLAAAMEPDVPGAEPLAADASASDGTPADDILLDGRFLSVDTNGSVTAWSARAEKTFGWVRAEAAGRPLAEIIAAGTARGALADDVASLLGGGPARRVSITAADNHGREFPAQLAMVPIRLAEGYAFNALLQDLAKQGSGAEAMMRLRSEHDELLASIRSAVESGEVPAGDEENRLVGALVLFEDLGPLRPVIETPEDEAAPAAPIADPGELEDARREADQAWRDAQEATERADKAAAEAEAAQAEAQAAQAEAEELRTALEEARAEAEAGGSASEQARTLLEESRAETAQVRGELEKALARVEQSEGALAEARTRAEEAEAAQENARARAQETESALEEARARAEQTEATLEEARARAEETQAALEAVQIQADERQAALEELNTRAEERESALEELRARSDALATELESTRTESRERGEAAERASAEAERASAQAEELRAELERANAEAERLGSELEDAGAAAEAHAEELAEARSALEELRGELERANAETDRLRQGVEETSETAAARERELAEARTEAERLGGELEAARSEAGELRADLDAARAAAAEAGGEVEATQKAVEDVRARAEETLAEAQQEAEELRAEAAQLRASAEAEKERADKAEAAIESADAKARAEAEEARTEAASAAEQAASAAEQAADAERFRLAFDEAPIGMALTSADGRFLRVNRSLCDLLGYSADSLLSDDPPSIVHDEDIDAKREMAAGMLSGERASAKAETRYLHADGRILHVQETVSLARDEEDEPLYFVFQFEDVTERKQLEEAAAELRDRDPITGLFNKRHFEEELSRKIAEAARHGGGGAALLLNLQDFDAGNLPQEAGEELLRTVAAALRDQLRNAELLARLSGDEFAVLLPDADADKAQTMAEQLVQAIGPQVVKVGDQSVRITLNVGVALFDERDHHNGPMAVGAVGEGSDGANLPVPVGRAGAKVAESSDQVEPERVHKAIEDDLFLIYCQPVVDLRTNDVAQYELLLRMVDDKGNLILPRAFLQTAEESGLIRKIDQWVVRRAIRLIAERARAGSHVRLEVNISHSSINDPDLSALVEHELITTGIDPASLILEVAESAAVADHEAVKDLAKRVRALGCKFAVDNFGSGVTSFRYIKDLPLDYLKLDGDLVATLPESRTDQLVVKAIVDIARGMSCQTIAEMVSDDETLFLLRQQGVDFAQGYQVGRPQPITEI